VPECPRGAGEVHVLAGGLIEGQGGALLGAGYEWFAVERSVGHQAVEVGVFASEVAVGAGERSERVVGVLERGFEAGGLFLKSARDDGCLECVFVG
jgi:hypothetical protein